MRISFSLVLLCCSFVIAPALASAPRPARLERARVADDSRRLDVNQLTLSLSNDGSLGPSRAPEGWSLLFPRGSTNGVLYAGGLWLGARVGGELRVTVSQYVSEFAPGAIVGGVADDPARPEYRVWKVARWSGRSTDTAHVERTSAELAADPTLDTLVHHGWSEYLANAAPHGAPVRTWDLPAPGGGTLAVPGPDVPGDLLLWSVFNDADASRHVVLPGPRPALGVEVRQSVFGYAGGSSAEFMAFVRWRIVNRSPQTLDSLTVGLWLDPDLGGPGDDFVGCDTTRSFGFTYNASASDVVYGWRPPALGADFLDESFDAARGRVLGMDAFAGYNKGRDPADARAAWNLMTGAPWAERPPEAGPFDRTGDPLTGVGDLDRFPSDRRMLLARNAGALAPGDSVELTAALVVGGGSNRLASLSRSLCLSDDAQALNVLGFPAVVPAPGPCPPEPLECPRTADHYAAQCAGGGELSPGQLDTLGAVVDLHSTTLSWAPGPPGDSLCAVLADAGDARAQARREYVAMLVNVLASNEHVLPAGSSPIRMDPLTPVSCTALGARNVGEAIQPAPTERVFAAEYRNRVPIHRRAIEGVPLGMRAFDGGAGPMAEFLGSGLVPEVVPDSFSTVRIEFDGTRPRFAHRYLRLEVSSTGDAPPQGRVHRYAGLFRVPFTARDSATGEPLEVGFVERCLTDASGTVLGPGQQPATFDSTWGPDASASGGHEYLMVARRPYTGTARAELAVDGGAFGSGPWLYALAARRRSEFDVIDDGDDFVFRYEIPGGPGVDERFRELAALTPGDPQVVAEYAAIRDCLASLNRGDWLVGACGETAPIPPALLSAIAAFDRVSLSWSVPPGGRELLSRRPPGQSFWEPLATLDVGASGRVDYEDLDVRPGERYGYRLGPGTAFGGPFIETFVDVPLPSRIALSPFLPNPAGGVRSVRVTLRSSERAVFEVLDVAGRLRVRRELPSPAPGSFLIPASDRLEPGIYLLRLTQGRANASAKGVIVR